MVTHPPPPAFQVEFRVRGYPVFPLPSGRLRDKTGCQKAGASSVLRRGRRRNFATCTPPHSRAVSKPISLRLVSSLKKSVRPILSRFGKEPKADFSNLPHNLSLWAAPFSAARDLNYGFSFHPVLAPTDAKTERENLTGPVGILVLISKSLRWFQVFRSCGGTKVGAIGLAPGLR
jgi:hypothetical protein